MARVLALQRSVGNAAVNRLLRVPAPATVPAAAPAAATPRTDREIFDSIMRERWSVGAVATGTMEHQIAEMRSMTPSAQAAPTTIAGWQSWSPGDSSNLYDDIIDGFENVAFVLGGVPAVANLRFLDTEYDNVGGTAQEKRDTGASYSAGRLNIYSRLETAEWKLPAGRSTATAQAGLDAGAPSDSRRRIIVHELCHGVYEGGGAAGGSQFFRDWEAAAGWVGGQNIQNGTVLTRANWNNDWPDQPVSRYSLSNAMEDFCESLMCFIEAGDVLRQRSPSRHAFIVARRAGWSSFLIAPVGFRRQVRMLRGPRGDFNLPTGDGRYA